LKTLRTSAHSFAAELLLLGFVVVSVAGVAYLPTHDGPQHIFTTHVANHFDEPGTGWSRWFEPNTPLSSQGFTAIFGPLDALLPWDSAARVSLALMVLLWALGAFCFVRAVRPERSWLGLPLGAAALQWSLYMGFFSFYTATAFGLFILAYAFRSAPEHPRQRLWLAVLLLLQAFMHVVPAILTGLMVATLLWLRAEPGRRSRELLRIALLPWDSAARISLALMTLLWALGAFCFVRAVRPERSWLGLPLGAAALQWSLYMGFFSFYTATAFGLFILAYAFRGAPEHPRQRLWLAVLLLLQAFMHVVPAILTGLTVAALLWLRAEPGRRSRELVRIALLGTPAALVAVAVLAMQLGVSGDIPEETEAAFQFGQPPWWTLGKCFLGGPAWRAWPLTFLAAGALLLPLARGLARWRARGSSSLRAEDAALLLTGGGFLLAGAVLPLHLPDWEFFSVRFLPMAVCALVASLPLERVRAPRWRAACAALLALFAFASTGWAYRYNRELAARSRDALAGLDADLTRDGWRLPIVLDPFIGRPFEDSEAAMPFMAPLINLGKLYATAQGGIPSYSFVANRAIHSVVMADDMREKSPPTADPRYTIDLLDPRNAGDQALRRAVTGYLASNATAYQDVILGRAAGRGLPGRARLRAGLAAGRTGDPALRRLPSCDPHSAGLGPRG